MKIVLTACIASAAVIIATSVILMTLMTRKYQAG